jgi:hypothetical protein
VYDAGLVIINSTYTPLDGVGLVPSMRAYNLTLCVSGVGNVRKSTNADTVYGRDVLTERFLNAAPRTYVPAT